MLTPLPGITDAKPTYCSYPMPGVQPVLVDPEGNEVEGNNVEGLLCIKHPWPSMLRTTYGDHERCRQVYFSAFKDMYFTGDGARRDEDGRDHQALIFKILTLYGIFNNYNFAICWGIYFGIVLDWQRSVWFAKKPKYQTKYDDRR